MSTVYSRYGVYKDSGVEWIGEVPEQWTVDKLKRSVISLKNGVWGEEAQGDENDVFCVRVADFDRVKFEVDIDEFTVRNLDRDKQENFLLRKGELLIEKSGGGDKQPVGCVVRYNSDAPAIYANFIARMVSNEKLTHPNFLKYIHACLYAHRINVRSIKQTTGIQNLDADYYLQELVPYPSVQEQIHISDFLDLKTGEINDLIADKEQMISLLEEHRQAVITEAVTTGLNPNVAMRGSAVDWVDKTPQHWGELKIKYLFYEVDHRNDEEDVELLSLFTHIGVRPRQEMEQKGNRAQTVIGYKKIKPDDVVVNKLLAWMGAIGVSDYEGVVSPDYDVYRAFDDRVAPMYYHYYFRSAHFKGDCYKYGRGIMMMRWRTYADQFKSILVLVPPYEEQVRICEYIRDKTREIEQLIGELRTLIAKLEEYRDSLIFEVVTGKTDVRHVVVEATA